MQDAVYSYSSIDHNSWINICRFVVDKQSSLHVKNESRKMKFNTIQIVFVVVFMIFLSHHSVLANVNDTNSTQNNDAEKPTRSEMAREDDITCHQNSTYVWCIPMDYSNRKEPWRYKDTIGATFPWFYHFKFTIFDIDKVVTKLQLSRNRNQKNYRYCVLLLL